jgi:hypothetical protein
LSMEVIGRCGSRKSANRLSAGQRDAFIHLAVPPIWGLGAYVGNQTKQALDLQSKARHGDNCCKAEAQRAGGAHRGIESRCAAL